MQKVRFLFLKSLMLFGITQTVQCYAWPTQTQSNAVRFNTARFNAIRFRLKDKKPVQALSTSWKPMCLGQLQTGAGKRPLPSSRTMLSTTDMKIFSNPEISGNRSPDGTLSLKDMPPEYFAILSTSAQNSSALMKDYAGVSGGMDLFGIRSMFVSPSTTTITSDFQ